MSFPAHGVLIDVTADKLVLHRTLLATSLGAPATEDIPLESIDTVHVSEPTPTGFGALDLGAAGTIAFAPHQDPQAVARAISAAQRGEAPSSAATIPGLDFTAVDVETANDNWGSICQIGAVRFRDGQETASRSWLCTPPPGLEHFADINVSIHGITADDVEGAPAFADVAKELFDFLGGDVLVAHNAQFDSTALRSGLLASGAEVPTVPLACSLALARDASKAKVISVRNHKLPTAEDRATHDDLFAQAVFGTQVGSHQPCAWRHGTCGNEAARADTGTRKQGGLHADEATIFNRGAVDQGHVSDGDIIAENRGHASVDMDCGVVLNIGALANANRCDVTSENRTVEHGAICTDFDITDNDRAGCNPGTGMNAWGLILVGENERSVHHTNQYNCHLRLV